MNMFKCLNNFQENVDKNMKLWTNISNLLMNIQLNSEMFIQFSRKCRQKHEIMDKQFESTYDHSSEPGKCGQLFFKFGQYCPHFLENSMNIRVYA